MQKQTLIVASVLIGSSLMPYIACAETTETTTTTTTNAPVAPVTPPAEKSPESTSGMTKENWLNTIVPMLPSLICKGFLNDPDLKLRLDAIKMDYDKCIGVIPESVNKCQNQISASIPDKVTDADASTWGKTLGECIGKDFAMKYLIPK